MNYIKQQLEEMMKRTVDGSLDLIGVFEKFFEE